MVLQSCNWCFTLNNYTHDDTVRLQALQGNSDVSYIVFGKEVGENGTPHYQGFVKFTSKKRLNGVKTMIGDCHFEVARNPTAAISYCKKDDDFTEFGELVNKQGKRTDIEEIKADIVRGETNLSYYAEHHSEFYCKYKRFIEDYIQFNRIYKSLTPKVLRLWQAELWNKLKLEPDDRKIMFYVDQVGNTGKSWFAKYYRQYHRETSQIMHGGKAADMALAYNENCRVLFIDIPRSKLEYFSYDFMEGVKDGIVSSPKYRSIVKEFEHPHIVVFMNTEPDMFKLSADRYDIVRITPDCCKIPAEPVP